MSKIVTFDNALQTSILKSKVLRLTSTDNCHSIVVKGNDSHIEDAHWIEKQRILCEGKGRCLYCERGHKRITYYSILVCSVVDNKLMPHVFEMTWPAFRELMGALKKYGPDSMIKMTRRGEKNETRYVASFEGKLTPEQQKQLDGMKFPDFSDVYDD